MRGELKAGQRVRIGGCCRVKHYAPGGTGVVMSGPHRTPRGEFCYLVQMEEDGRNQTVLLFADEIETDAGEARGIGEADRR
jgi:hypothetical protein